MDLEKDQEPMHPTQERAAEFLREQEQHKPSSQRGQTAMQYAKGLGRFLVECCMRYLEDNERRRERSSFHRERRTCPCEEEEDEENKKKQAKQKQKEKEKERAEKEHRSSRFPAVLAGIGAVAMSLYSTYRVSQTWSEITFHDQLELLLDHVQAILRSVQVWIQEHESLGDPVPEMVRRDVVRIRQLVETLER